MSLDASTIQIVIAGMTAFSVAITSVVAALLKYRLDAMRLSIELAATEVVKAKEMAEKKAAEVVSIAKIEAKKVQDKVDAEAKLVRKELVEATHVSDGKLDVIHKLMNNNTALNLETIMRQAERIKNDHPGDAGDLADWEKAVKNYNDHMASQAVVDAGIKAES